MENIMYSIHFADALDIGFLNLFVQLTAYIIPYFLIPAALKAGMGAFGMLTGMINDRSRGLFDRQRKKRASMREYSMEHAPLGRRARTAARASAYQTLMDRGSTGDNWLKKKAYRGVARGVGGYNIAARASATQAAVSKEIGDQIATGDDTEVRALTARRDATSSTGWRSLAGREVNEASVMRAQSRWGRDRFAQQAAVAYEMRKANTSDEADMVAKNYASLAKDTWGMTDNQVTNTWIGAAFENQNKHLAFKNMRAQKSGDGKIIAGGEMTMSPDGYKAFAKEVYESRGSYNMAQMSGHTIEALQEAYDSGDDDTKAMVQAAAETFMSRYGGGSNVQAMDDNRPIQAGGSPAGGQPSYQTNTPGAAHTAEAVRKLAVHVGVYRPLDPSTDTHSAGGPSSNPRQN